MDQEAVEVCFTLASEGDVNSLKKLRLLCLSSEMREHKFPPLMPLLANLLVVGWASIPAESGAATEVEGDAAVDEDAGTNDVTNLSQFAGAVHGIYLATTRFPEFDAEAAKVLFTPRLAFEALWHAERHPNIKEVDVLSEIVRNSYYLADTKTRAVFRLSFGDLLSRVGQSLSEMSTLVSPISEEDQKQQTVVVPGITQHDANNMSSLSESAGVESDLVSLKTLKISADPQTLVKGLRVVLRVLVSVISGMQGPTLSKTNLAFLQNVLMPLHALPGKVTHNTPATTHNTDSEA